MPNIEIYQSDDRCRDLVSVHEGLRVRPTSFRDYQAWVRNGFEVIDEAGEAVAYLAADQRGIRFTEGGVSITGIAMYHNVKDRLSGEGNFFYERLEGYDGYTPPGPPVGREQHTWIISFPGA